MWDKLVYVQLNDAMWTGLSEDYALGTGAGPAV